MPNNKFDAKSFNAEAFKYLISRIPNLKMNELRKSKAVAGNPDVKSVFASQDGTGYARLAMRGLLDGDAVNYDGQTDIAATSTKTFEQGVVVIGRAKAWTEKDFSYDITGGQDFMQNIAQQVAEYWTGVDQATILAILEGVFGMTDAKGKEFVDNHTYDVTGADDGCVTVTTLNSAMQQACGANKKKFSLVFMHSAIATNLENLNLIKHLTYTDKDGVTRDIELYTWNGRLVVVDDDLPAATGEDGSTVYTTYVLGDGAISFEDIGAKVPYEMARDPKTNGGVDTLYTRQRKAIVPFGISYEKKSQATLSPTDAELKTGDNWALVNSGETAEAKRSYINHKAIPIARILSKG
ncbi:MAG: major capsid protein [Muribaculaceae bacterium]|nr:major capsid protein [Muribaculaceae bacterium]MCM1440360.1 major capsid protein [Roseburia sp.]